MSRFFDRCLITFGTTFGTQNAAKKRVRNLQQKANRSLSNFYIILDPILARFTLKKLLVGSPRAPPQGLQGWQNGVQGVPKLSKSGKSSKTANYMGFTRASQFSCKFHPRSPLETKKSARIYTECAAPNHPIYLPQI